jgi:hypothetical protein
MGRIGWRDDRGTGSFFPHRGPVGGGGYNNRFLVKSSGYVRMLLFFGLAGLEMEDCMPEGLKARRGGRKRGWVIKNWMN